MYCGNTLFSDTYYSNTMFLDMYCDNTMFLGHGTNVLFEHALFKHIWYGLIPCCAEHTTTMFYKKCYDNGMFFGQVPCCCFLFGGGGHVLWWYHIFRCTMVTPYFIRSWYQHNFIFLDMYYSNTMFSGHSTTVFLNIHYGNALFLDMYYMVIPCCADNAMFSTYSNT